MVLNLPREREEQQPVHSQLQMLISPNVSPHHWANVCTEEGQLGTDHLPGEQHYTRGQPRYQEEASSSQVSHGRGSRGGTL